MHERIERPDAPDDPAARLPEHVGDDLRQRLNQMADGHPSSDHYHADGLSRRDGGRHEVRGQPDRPAERDVHVTPDRERHILDGDPQSAGGGHRHGTGRPGKTEFPNDWPDDEIVSVVADVGRNPDHVEWQPNGSWRVFGDRDGVRVYAVVRPDGRIWTAWPEPGGKGVVQNPEAS